MSEETNTETDFIAAPSPADAVVGKPPRARVEDAVDPDESPRETMQRKRDYLEGFLQKQPENVPAGAPGATTNGLNFSATGCWAFASPRCCSRSSRRRMW